MIVYGSKTHAVIILQSAEEIYHQKAICDLYSSTGCDDDEEETIATADFADQCEEALVRGEKADKVKLKKKKSKWVVLEGP